MMPPEVHSLAVTAAAAGLRLDVFVAQALPHLSRSAAQRAIDTGQVLLNGQVGKARLLVAAGQTVTVTLLPPTAVDVVAEAMPLDVVYEDADLIVVNKPAGLVVHPARGNWAGTLVNALLAHCHDLSGIGGELRPGIVHRLDKDTSGLLVAAKHDRAHQGLAAQLANRSMHRTYLALVLDEPAWDQQWVDAPLGRHATLRLQQAVVADGRMARTQLTVVARYGVAALLRAALETGRTHQVRVHCTHLGHPLLGDPLYGARRLKAAVWPPEVASALAALPGQALHAAELHFTHPVDGRLLAFAAPPPAAFESVRQALAATWPAPPVPRP